MSLSETINLPKSRPAILIAILLLFAPSTLFAKFLAPPMTSPVVDQAAIISASDKQQLNLGLAKLYQETEIQIAILTLDTLENTPIEKASIDIVDQWKLGKEKSDKGVLLLVAVEDRAVRIEVGQGLEGTLTDAYSKRIIDQLIVPLFRSGNQSQGIVAGVFGIISYAAPELDPQVYLGGSKKWTSAKNPSVSTSGSTPFRPGLLIIIIFILFKLIVFFSRIAGGSSLSSRRYRGSRSSGWGGGGWSSGSGGSSWSGGGGGFSGGGASGKW